MDPTPSSLEHSKDPLEAIYALNIGDFMADAFISDDLLNKIASRLGDDPQKLTSQLEELIQIYSIDKTLGILGFKSDEGFVIYDSIAATLAKMFQVDACHIFQSMHKDSGADSLSLTGSSVELSSKTRWNLSFPLPENHRLWSVYHDSEAQVFTDLKSENGGLWTPLSEIHQDKTTSLIAAPMAEGAKYLGLILFERYSNEPFSTELIELANATARVFVTSTRLQQLVAQAQTQIGKETPSLEELRSLRAQITESIADLGSHQQAFVEALGGAIDARNHFTRGHSKQVAHVAQALAFDLRLNEKTCDLIYYAGLVGTLGKIDIPSEVLAKKETLAPQEWDSLRNHPNVGVGLLVQINFLSEVVPYVHYQKERWDGSGSPEGLSGQSIPLGSRILAVADAYHAMTQARPYRDNPISHDDAVAALKKEAGTLWDPTVVNALSEIPTELLL
ncbi:MAG: HD domain-containing protein [Cyanobacteria bacterium]|nr:HD domain-containing protein [Cyanobacteriota bacterium]